MALYVVSRKRVWHSQEELDAFVECAPSIAAQFAEHVRWVRSYVLAEDDGSLSAYCFYEATGPEWIERLSEAAMMPAASIRPVAATLAAA